jgi:hypothetical protein
MAISAKRKSEVVADIKEALQQNPEQRWVWLLDKYPDVPKQSIYRWIKAEKSPRKTPLRKASKKIDKAVKVIGEHLPAVPSPEYVAAKGTDQIDFLGRLNTLLGHTDNIIAHATKNADRPNNHQLMQAVKCQSDLLGMGLKAMGEVYNFRRMQRMHDAILSVLRRRDPSLAVQVLEDLEALDREMGITVNGQRD